MENFFIIKETGRNMVKSDKQLYNIGWCLYPEDRMKIYQKLSPVDLILDSVYECTDCEILEKKIHKKYGTKMLQNDWFCLTEQELQEIKQEIPILIQKIQQKMNKNKDK